MANNSVWDWLLMMAAIAASWQMAHVIPPGLEGADDTPRRTPPALPRLDAALERELKKIGQTGGYADIAGFLEGARRTYEQVVAAFAAGRLAPVASLLDPAVHQAFAEAIAARQARGETQSTTLVGLDAVPVDAGAVRGLAWIDMRFRAELVSVTFGPGGQAVAGDARALTLTDETWTFARRIGAPGPDWLLVATQAEG